MSKKQRFRKPSEGLLHARQVPKLRLWFRVWLAENEDKYRYCGQKLGIESTLNALIVLLKRMPEKERGRVMAECLAEAAAMEDQWQAEMRAEVAAGRLVADKNGNLAEPPAVPTSHSRDVDGGRPARRRPA